METAIKESLKKHLMREALQENERFYLNGNKTFKKSTPAEKKMPLIETISSALSFEGKTILPDFPPLVDVQVLHLPFDDSTDAFGHKAVSIPGSESPCYKWMSKTHLQNGEINLAAVQGQLFGTAYSNQPFDMPQARYTNNSCGVIAKGIKLNQGHGYSFNVQVVATISVILPENPEAVYYVDLGNLNLSLAGVEGSLTNTISYWNEGHWKSNSRLKTFLHSVKSASGTSEDIYISRPDDQLDITILAGTKEFIYSAFAQIMAFTSRDLSNTQDLDTSNYGLALIDLRNRISGSNTPIALRPFTNDFKAAPGGIRITSVVFEIFKVTA